MVFVICRPARRQTQIRRQEMTTFEIFVLLRLNIVNSISFHMEKFYQYRQFSAPAFVPPPMISREEGGIQQTTRDVVISTVVDESNGSIRQESQTCYKNDQFCTYRRTYMNT